METLIKRYISMFIDLFIYAFFTSNAVFVVNLFISLIDFESSSSNVMVNKVIIYVSLIVMTTFFYFREYRGLSLGYTVFHLSVKDMKTGEKPKRRQAIVRALFDYFYIFDLLVGLVTKDNRSLSDILSGTEVLLEPESVK